MMGSNNDNKKTIRRGLYLILTDPPFGYQRMTEMAVAEGIPLVQLRYTHPDVREFLKFAHIMRQITWKTNTKLIINDRLDIALMVHADGVHLGQNDVPVKEARVVLGNNMIIGLSTHNLEQVKKAQSEPIDYIGFGPVYKPFQKNNHEPVTGIHALGEAVEASRLPVVAIGGISRHRLDEIITFPIHNVACIGAIASAKDPAEEMRAMHSKIIEAKQSFARKRG